MSWLESTRLDNEEEVFPEETSEFSYSEYSSEQSEPLDLSMKPWFADGSPGNPFREAVSFTKLTFLFSIFVIMLQNYTCNSKARSSL